MARKQSTRATARKPTPTEVVTAAQVRAAREKLAGPDGPGNFKDVSDIISDVIRALHDAESVAITVCGSLLNLNTTESVCAEATLRIGCGGELTHQIQRLESVLEAVRISGSPRLIVEDVREVRL